ncbi:unnamed protein product [Mytilus coruscus]|uniref:EGF-like domain-containing protein n=1 Tax=Mytilus coruscus TaxID=42192 RepID=A0A6J8D241_MYTCO|nr:unnamed protein product [Mytilus coruscus]
MNSNPITTIEEGTFQNMPLLHRVLLQGCNISTIETGAFMTLPNLQYLYLDNNQITTIQKGAFKDLPALRYIWLYNNQITAIPRGIFDDLKALTNLDMQNNQITTIQHGAFQNLPALQILNLRGNNVTFVKNDTFEHNTNLQYLYLDLVCDCNFPLWSWLKSKSWLNDAVICLDRDDIKLSSLQESDFDNCTFTDDLCYPEYCSNGGSCSHNSYGDLVCSCVSGWTGTTCTGMDMYKGRTTTAYFDTLPATLIGKSTW